MNTKQKTVIGCGLAVVIAIALYPPWATWCPVYDRDVQVQYGWLFGRVNYPECAEKLTDWTWGLASDRLLLQMGLGDHGDGGVDGCIPVNGHRTNKTADFDWAA
jgi:hypothetical protein